MIVLVVDGDTVNISTRADFDVIIIGSGPSGASCAYWAAKSGLNVLLIDKNKFPRSKTCGDGLTWESIQELRLMHLWEVIEPLSQIYNHVDIINRNDGEIITSWNDDSNNRWGAVIERIDLDYQIILHAVKSGAVFIDKLQIDNIVNEKSMYILTCTKNATRYHFSTKYIVVATGANRSILSKFDIPYKRRYDSLAVRTYINLPHSYDVDRLRIHIEESMTGYGWMFPLRKQTGNLGVGITISDSHTTTMVRDLLRVNLHQLMKAYGITREMNHDIHGYPILSDFPDSIVASGNIIIVGEAAGLVDPLTGEGIGPSLVSARHAACSIIDNIGGIHTISVANMYRDKIHETYGRYYRESRILLDISGSKIGTRVFSSIPAKYFSKPIHVAVFQQKPINALEIMHTIPELADHRENLDILLLLRYKRCLVECRELMVKSVINDNIDPHIIQIVEKGRMLRALLVFIGAKVAGGEPEKMISGAAGIELVHCASLIHDDIIDNAEYRRGIPALHRVNSINQSIVIGDYLIAKSFELLAHSRSHNPDSYVVDAFIVGAISGIIACRGQYRDSMIYDIEEWDEKTYIELITQKTASVITGALISGAKLAGCDKITENILYSYGLYLGIAFQLKDDIDDINDIQNGSIIDKKINLPIIYAYRIESNKNREIIRQFLRDELYELKTLSNILNQTYVRQYCHNSINQYISRAIESVACIYEKHPELHSIARAVWNISNLHDSIFSQ